MNMPPSLNRTAIVVALALTLAGCGKTPEQHFQQAQQLVQKREYKAAIIELKTVLQEQPDNRDARQLLGEVFFKNAAYPDAEKELSRARNLGTPDEQVLPTLAEVYVRMGEPQKTLDLGVPATGLSAQSLAKLHVTRAEALLSLGNKAAAEKSVEAAKLADPGQPKLMLTQAKLALIDRQKERATQLVDDAIQKEPTFAEALYLKAALLESENQRDEAVKVYQQILANDPAEFRAHLAIAGLLLQKGDIKAADKAIEAAEKVAGKAPMVMYARGTLELQRGNLEKASSTLLDVLRVTPDHLPSVLAYAMASYGLGNYEQSISNASRVLRSAPANLMAAKVLAGSQLKTGDAKGALKTLSPFLTRHPGDSRLLALAGDAHLRAGDYSKAMSYLDKASELEPESAAIRTRQAAGYLASGDSKEAMAALEQAVSLSDKPGQADLMLVMMRLNRKDYGKALEDIATLEKKLPNNPVTHNLRAAALLGKQDRAGARKALEQALAIQPTFIPAAINLAQLDMQDKKPEAARKRFESILAQDKDNVKAMLALADLAAAEKRETEFVRWLEKAAKADPKAIPPRARLARFYLDKKDNRKAMALAREASNANPDSLQAMNLLARTQLATGDGAAAIETYNRMLRKAPRSADILLSLALAQISDKQPGAARATLKQALQHKPDFLKAQDALLRLELEEKNPEAALQIARRIQAQQPASPLGFDREADILMAQKRYPQAVKTYEQALTKGAGTAGLIKLHRALYIAGDTKAADQRLSDWIRQYPKDLAARAYAADVYLQTQRNREAIAQYEMLLKANPNHVIALNNLANLYQRAKDSRAAATAEQAFKLAPDSPAVQDTLGWILVEQGQLPRGLDLLGKAATKLPKQATVRYHYGVALARSNKKSAARKELEAAIASGQKFPELGDARALLKSL